MIKKRKLSKKEEKALIKTRNISENIEVKKVEENIKKEDKEVVEIAKIITVREFSAVLGLPVTKVISELMKNGVMASINESIDFDTAVIIGDELGYEIKLKKISESVKTKISDSDKKLLKIRPPIVVVMGHVDHGKTTLLDTIRKTNVVADESGGITQHIGAYQLNWKDKEKKNRLITFLDTPGHEAFSAMRAHGANITDIAILVVAADDGVKPQTKEAISHAKAANVPIVVAINKIDKPDADPEKVKRELSNVGLIPEEWGGDTVMLPISAKKGKNIDELLDLVLIVSDMKGLYANPKKPGEGVVIESHMQSGVGPVATVLVKDGTFKVGQIALVGNTFGKIRLLEDYKGKRIQDAGPSTPIRIAGLHNIPKSGELLEIVSDERSARNKIASRSFKTVKIGLAEISEEAKKGKLNELNIILKADVQGSLEAITNSLESIGGNTIKVNILSEAVGNIAESDINMAVSSKAIIVGFKVIVPSAVKKFADDKGIKISIYDIIYNLIDDITLALEGMYVPEYIEEIVGKLSVLKVFYRTKNNIIIGGKVIDGKIKSGTKVHLYHSGEKHGEGKISTLMLEKNPVGDVLKGFECGLGIDTTTNIKPGDIVESYETTEKSRKINN